MYVRVGRGCVHSKGGRGKEIDGFRRRGFHQGEAENVVIG